MPQFNIGDRVVISRDSHYYDRNWGNPPDSVIGTVIELVGTEELPIRVNWDLPVGRTNFYGPQDLRLVTRKNKKGFGVWVKALENGSEE